MNRKLQAYRTKVYASKPDAVIMSEVVVLQQRQIFQICGLLAAHFGGIKVFPLVSNFKYLLECLAILAAPENFACGFAGYDDLTELELLGELVLMASSRAPTVLPSHIAMVAELARRADLTLDDLMDRDAEEGP